MAYTTLISTGQLAESGNDVCIIDCRSSLTDPGYGQRSYEEGHIPGALFANLDRDLSRRAEAHEGRHPLPDPAQFCQFLGALGVEPGTQVVAYDDVSGAIAGRLWWMLSRWLGHENVAVLDGGFKRWVAEDRAISTDVPQPAAVQYTAEVDDSAWVSTADLEAALGAGTLTVIDARTAARYRGDEEPIDPVAGHIPGAVSRFLGGNLENGCYQDAAALKARFEDIVQAAGGAENVVHSCGSGVSALHNMIAMERAGLTGSRLYVGSWSEWIRDSARPVAVGD